MGLKTTSAALTVLAAAIGTALVANIVPIKAESNAESVPQTAQRAEREEPSGLAMEANYAPPAAVGTSGMALPDFRTIVRNNVDAIVKIEVKENAKPMNEQRGQSGDPFQDFFQQFGNPNAQRPPQQGMGSGFIIAGDGKILTNAHVVKGADVVSVRLNDQREFKAKVIGLDENTDVALLKIEAKGLPIVSLGNSDGLEVGEWVLAIGAPFGLDYSATQGIVSATGRELPNENYVPFIQTDAAVNPGNSGGPLFNVQGEVIGINSQIYSRSGGYMGLSFAIPIKTAMGIAKQLESKGFVERGWLGVVIQEMNPQLAQQFGLDKPTGALVGDVSPGSPAEAAGLKAGDVILKFGSQPVKSSRDLPPIVAATPIGEKTTVEIMRDGSKTTLDVKVGKLKEDRVASLTPTTPDDATALNLTVQDLNEQQREQLGVKQGGVVVTEVDNGPAAEAGVREGDVVLQVNRKPVTSAKGFSDLVQARKKSDSTLLLIRRGGSSVFIVVEPQAG